MKGLGQPGPGSGGGGRKSRRPTALAGAALVVGVTAAGAGIYVQRRRARVASGQPVKRFQVHSTVVEALAGAIGEIAQISLLYPLDTIKVRCQSSGLSAGVVVRELLQQGFNLQLLHKLYAGVVGAAVCSIMVGAVHYASYETSRRQITAHLTTAPFLQTSAVSTGSSSSGGSTFTQTMQTSDIVGVERPARSADEELEAEASSSGRGEQGAGDTGRKGRRGKGKKGSKVAHGQKPAAAGSEDSNVPSSNHNLGAASSGSGASSINACTADSAAASVAAVAAVDKRPKIIANVLAAVIAALVTAVVESPCELFRHNAQAGLMPGSFLQEMLTVVRKEGPSGLYWGFLPHCLEAWPHDISELMTYGYMKDATSDAAQPNSRHYEWMRSVPVHVCDLVTGAVAGAAAVCISMPFDTCKTYMQTHGTSLEGKSLLRGMQLFVSTGQRMVAKGGISSLYVGMTPRLLQQVPSAMICWYSIEAFQRFMLPYTYGNGLLEYEQERVAVVGDDGHVRPVESALSISHSTAAVKLAQASASHSTSPAPKAPSPSKLPVLALDMELQPLSRSILWPQLVPVGLSQVQQRRLAVTGNGQGTPSAK